VQHVLDVQPDLIVTGNAGCSLQLQAQQKLRGKAVPVLHPMQLLDLSYRNLTLKDLE
jgi:glycolate oxidase iron-sulfur subunit